jgi:hypothetical protein
MTTFKIIKGRQPPVRFDLHTNIPYAVQNFGIGRLKYLIVCLINCSSINDQNSTLNNHWYFNQRKEDRILFHTGGLVNKIFKITPAFWAVPFSLQDLGWIFLIYSDYPWRKPQGIIVICLSFSHVRYNPVKGAERSLVIRGIPNTHITLNIS